MRQVVPRLREGLNAARADVAVAEVEGQVQPVFALMRRDVLPHLSAYLARSGRRADGWYQGLNSVAVRFGETAAFANVNTLEDLGMLDSRR